MKHCEACGYHKDWRLPKITKKIIYLDQFVISNMVKAKQRSLDRTAHETQHAGGAPVNRLPLLGHPPR